MRLTRIAAALIAAFTFGGAVVVEAQTATHRYQSATADDPTKEISSGEWNDSHVFSGGANTYLMCRDSGQADGWNWCTVNGFTADGTPDGAADYVMTWDASAATHKKVLLDTLVTGGGGAPADADYLVGTANGSLSAEIVVSPLTDDRVLIANGTTWEVKAIPDCTDTGGNHLNYTASTNALSCGTSGGASGYATIQDEGSGLTQRTTLNFTGAGVSCADNGGSSRTDCTISGGGGGGSMQRLVWSANQAIQSGTGTLATQDTRNGHPVLDFDATTDECSYFHGFLPSTYTGGGLTLTLIWMATTATTGNVVWEGYVERHDDDAFDLDADGFAALQHGGQDLAPSVSGEVSYDDITFTSGAQMDSLAAGESFRLKVCRDADSTNATDDMTGDAELYRVIIKETGT